MITSVLAATVCVMSQGAPVQTDAEVERLVRLLGATSFEQREQATRRLSELGARARPALERAATGADLEVRLRAGELLAQLDERALWEPTRVTLTLAKVKARTAFERLGELTANPMSVSPGVLEHSVDVDFQNVPFWQAVTHLCRKTNALVRPRGAREAPLWLVERAPAGTPPMACDGPVCMRITRAHRTLSRNLDFAAGVTSGSHRLRLSAELLWESKLRVLAHGRQPEVHPVEPGQRPSVQNVGSGWSNLTGRTLRAAFSVPLNLSDPTCSALERLDLALPMIATGKEHVLEIDDVPHQKGKTFRKGRATVTVTDITPADRRWSVTLDIVRPASRKALSHQVAHGVRLQLFDRKGNEWRGSRRKTQIAGPRLLHTVEFRAHGEVGPPHRLHCRFAGLLSERTLKFQFVKLPLPAIKSAR